MSADVLISLLSSHADLRVLTTQDPRWIMHLDMGAYFAAVDQRDKPDLRSRSVMVDAQPGGRGGVAVLDCGVEGVEVDVYGEAGHGANRRSAGLSNHARFDCAVIYSPLIRESWSRQNSQEARRAR